MMLGQNETAEQVAIVKKKYGFDQPLVKQYAYYINDLSPLSFHSMMKLIILFFQKINIRGFSLFSVLNTNVVLKTPLP